MSSLPTALFFMYCYLLLCFLSNCLSALVTYASCKTLFYYDKIKHTHTYACTHARTHTHTHTRTHTRTHAHTKTRTGLVTNLEEL